jgi:hypothetical protein
MVMKFNHILLAFVLTSAPATAFAGETCAYVLGTIGGQTVITPASVFNLPGAVVETPTISLNVAGLVPLTVPGQVITVSGRTIVLTGVSVSTPPVSVSTPQDTLTVDINGTLQTITYLLPPT